LESSSTSPALAMTRVYEAAVRNGSALPRHDPVGTCETSPMTEQFPWRPFLVSFAIALAINALALWIANGLFGGVVIEGWSAYIFGALVLGVANAILKPILALLTLPLILVTLGLFYLLINIGMIALTAWIVPNFSVSGFWTYVGVVIVVWLVNWAGNAFLERSIRTFRG